MNKKTLLIISIILFSFIPIISGYAEETEGDYTGEHWDTGDANAPTGMTTDGTNIWIADTSKDEVYKYDMAGGYISSWDVSGQTDNPMGITTDGTNIWISSNADTNVYKYDMVGGYIGSWDTGDADEPWDMATDGTNIWIPDTDDDQVYKYNMAGAYISKFNTTAPNGNPIGITTDGTYIWVADPIDEVVYKYTMIGTYLTSWSTTNEGSGQFSGITTDGIYIWGVDPSFAEVYKYYYKTQPTITSAQIQNMDNTNDLFPIYRWYEFEVVTDDISGADEIAKVYLRGKDGANTIFEVRGDSLNSTPAWTIQTGSDIIDLDSASCSWDTSGTQGNATFFIRIEYDHPQYLDIEIDAYAEDAGGANSSWVNAKTDYYDTISNIVTTFNLDDDRGNLSQPVTASGQITFEASNLYPSDSNFTGVSVYDSSNNNEGTDSTIVNGEWEITFNTPGTVGLDTYNLYIDIIADYPDGEETTPTDTFTNDRYNVTSFWASEYNPQIGDNITLYAIFESEYDSHICDGDDSITIEDISFNYDPIEEYYFAEVGKEESGTYYFDTLNSLHENTYDITSGNLDYNLSVTWGNFKYDFYGPFHENGTASGNTTIYIHFTDTTESFTLEGEANKTYTVMPLMVRWDLEGGASRVIYPISDNETYYIFEPFTDYGGYVFTIKDYSNVIGSQNSFLEALETINGTKRLIVRQLIWDTVNPITLILQKDATYEIQIRTLTGYIYNYGYFTPAVDTTRILIISEVEWGKQIHYVGADLIIEALRPSGNHIQVNYKDETEGTESIFIEICLRNNTQVWNATSTEQMIQFNWHNAVNTTGYIIKMTIEHELYGTCEYTTFIPECKPDVPTFPDFDILGEGLTAAFGVLLIIVPLLVFSRAHMIFGMFCTNIMAYIVTYLEILTIPYAIIHVVMAFTIIWGLWEADKQ